MGRNFAYELSLLTPSALIEGLYEAQAFGVSNKFSLIGSRFRDLIHGIPKSYTDENYVVSQMEVYLGVAHAHTLFNRLKHHQEEKKHTYGLIVGFCPEELVGEIEITGIKLLKKLEEMGKLCVANANVSPHKGSNLDDVLVLYMTWKFDRRAKFDWNAPSVQDRANIISDLVSDPKISFSRLQIKKVVDGLHKRTSYLIPHWAL